MSKLGIECFSHRVVGNLKGSMNTFWPPTNPTGPGGNLNGSFNKDQRVCESTLDAGLARDVLANSSRTYITTITSLLCYEQPL